ncbi:uncharacterized protein LOC114518650 [Dendronephthya gigantea]|uniref:uncharacterized protein LOC114518650 n=1 Tax=Dendronephthya gigantea TaxID=151771 RepID=UPI00106A9220|nr:uncharacterized protein LOC114518650 [Dendronephthya gigantea]
MYQQLLELIDGYTDEKRANALQVRETINETLRAMKELDSDILKFIVADKESTEEDVAKEIEESSKLRAEAKKLIKRLYERLKLTVVNSQGISNGAVDEVNVGASTSFAASEDSSEVITAAKRHVAQERAKLPKLEVKDSTKICGKNYHKWTVDDLLTPLKEEISLREEHHHKDAERGKDGRERGDRRWNPGTKTTQAFLTKVRMANCAFCLGQHHHEDCKKVKTLENRMQIIIKYSRCFKCLNKGHIGRNCSIRVKCSACKKEHHTALCDAENNPEGLEVEGEEGNLSPTNGTGTIATLVVSPKNKVVKLGCSVALQTAQAMLVGQKTAQARVLFDSGSQRSFVTTKWARELGCKMLRRELLSVGAFGQRALKTKVREVVQLDLKSIRGDVVVSVEAYVVPEISFIRNHLDLVQDSYSHLKGLWLADVCMSNVELEIYVLVGADYLWMFHGDRIVHCKADEPVAIETLLGWVLWGPVGLASRDADDSAVVSIVSCEPPVDVGLVLGVREY